ncbi:MAG: hypothetical protein R6W70_06055 [bacterium]
MRFFSFLFLMIFFTACGENSVSIKEEKDIPVHNPEKEVSDTDEMDTDTFCGDGVVEGDEVCEKEDTKDCVEIDAELYESGKAECLDDCSGWNTLNCVEVPHECGNGIVENPEVCDSDSVLCTEIDGEKYIEGTASCLDDCSGYDMSECIEAVDQKCGNGVVEGTEVCEQDDLILCTKIDEKLYSGGKAVCKDDCTGWNISSCDKVKWSCGDGVVEGPEVCEQGDSSSCVNIDSSLYSGGMALCADDCLSWNISDCMEESDCENECFSENVFICEESRVLVCKSDSNGCMKWETEKDCSDTGRLCEDNILVGNTEDENVMNRVFKGNILKSNADRKLESFSVHLYPEVTQTLYFAVYKSGSESGTYEKIAESEVPVKAEDSFFNSGKLSHISSGEDIYIENGSYYILGTSWEFDLLSYFNSSTPFTDPLEVETTVLGDIVGGVTITENFPVPSTLESPSNNNAIYHQIYYTDTMETDICVCDNSCTPGSNGCNDSWITECAEDDYGCFYWADFEDCADNSPPKICTSSGGIASCVYDCENECSEESQKRCEGTILQICETGSEGCLIWKDHTDCVDDDKYCSQTGDTAECVENPSETTDSVGDDSRTGSSGGPSFRGVYFFVEQPRTLTEYKVRLSSPGTEGSETIPFMIFKNDSESGEYERILNKDAEVSALDGYFGPETISVYLEPGYYYIIGWFSPKEDFTFYFHRDFFSPRIYETVFGKSAGHVLIDEKPGETHTFPEAGNATYQMTLTTE